MKVAIVYDRTNKWGGAERVLIALHKMFPDAPLYTSVYDPKGAPWAKVFPEIKTSFLQKIPFLRNKHELLPYLMPLAFESFNFDGYDLVISVTSEAAKGIITRPGTRHVCYMLTPTRYLWSGYKDYFKNIFLRVLSYPVVSYLRSWDKVAAQRPDKIISISSVVKQRVKKYYNRESDVIFPPITLKTTTPNRKITKKGNYYLVVSRLVPYKKVDLAIKAFNKLKYPLIIIGKGSEEERLRDLSTSKSTKFAGHVSDKELSGYYSNCKALIFPQDEDFGLTAVEAQSFGKPVIAFRGGGALDMVIENKTGVFFTEQVWQSLHEAVERFEKLSFDSKIIVRNAGRFSEKVFRTKFLELLKSTVRT